MPRPGRARIGCQPGWVAAVAVAVALTYGVVSWSGYGLVRHQGWRDEEYVARFWRLYRRPFGPAVAGSWLALAASRRWRPARDWVDRLGRALGLFWIATMLLDWPFRGWFTILDRLRGGSLFP